MQSQQSFSAFSQRVIQWHAQYGRKSLPWHENRTAYRVWLSEIMLQQTQVTTVIPYFYRFTERFSDLTALATANVDEVFYLWSGLGYYSRARNLLKTARQLVRDYDGEFPDTVTELMKLPGIGRSTAGAIISQAFNKPAAVLDGNVKRLLTRHYGIIDPINQTKTEKQLWQLAVDLLPAVDAITHSDNSNHAADYTQGCMDLGALLCTRKNPNCELCPLQQTCYSYHNQLTDQLPKRVAKTVKPIKSQEFVLFQSNQRILLRQQNSRGVWAGLWILPTAEQLQSAKIPFSYAIGEEFLQFRHTFSHYHLDCSILEAVAEGLHRPQTGWLWYNYKEPATIGLPSPMQKVIQQWQLRQELDHQEGIDFAAEPPSTYQTN